MPAFAFLGTIAGCSLRNTDSLDSGLAAGGSKAGSGGTPGSAGAQAGSGAPSGGSAGLPSGGTAAGGNPAAGATSQAGASNGGGTAAGGSGGNGGSSGGGSGDGGSAGMVEPVLGSFFNCPGRWLWKVDSNPSAAQVKGAFNIPDSQLLPQYAIDDTDGSGTVTRYSIARPMQGNEWISVDMGVEKWVSGVYTKEASGDYGRSYEVSVSRDGNTFTPVATQEGMVGAYDIPFTPVIARFVRLSQHGTTVTEWWSLHDYKVYCTEDAVPGGTGGSGAGGGGGSSAGGSSAGGGGAGAGSGGAAQAGNGGA